MPIENLLEFEASPAAESTGELVPELVLKRALS
jgi:hypothetical protein